MIGPTECNGVQKSIIGHVQDEFFKAFDHKWGIAILLLSRGTTFLEHLSKDVSVP